MMKYLIQLDDGTILQPGRGPMDRETLDAVLAERKRRYDCRKAAGHPKLPHCIRILAVQESDISGFVQQIDTQVHIPA